MSEALQLFKMSVLMHMNNPKNQSKESDLKPNTGRDCIYPSFNQGNDEDMK